MDKQLWVATAVIVIGYLMAFYFQNHRIDDLKDSLNKRIDDLGGYLANQLHSEVNRLEDLVRSETKRLEDRLDRLEHPVARP